MCSFVWSNLKFKEYSMNMKVLQHAFDNTKRILGKCNCEWKTLSPNRLCNSLQKFSLSKYWLHLFNLVIVFRYQRDTIKLGQYVNFQSVDNGLTIKSLIELFPICQINGFPFQLPCTKLPFHLFDALVAREDGRAPISNQVWVKWLYVIWEFLSKIYFVISDSPVRALVSGQWGR